MPVRRPANGLAQDLQRGEQGEKPPQHDYGAQENRIGE